MWGGWWGTLICAQTCGHCFSRLMLFWPYLAIGLEYPILWNKNQMDRMVDTSVILVAISVRFNPLEASSLKRLIWCYLILVDGAKTCMVALL